MLQSDLACSVGHRPFVDPSRTTGRPNPQLSRSVIIEASADEIERLLSDGALVCGYAAISALLNRIRFASSPVDVLALNALIPKLVSAGASVPELNPDRQYPLPGSTVRILECCRNAGRRVG